MHDALKHLQSALDLLDRAAAPGHIGAQVDHAVHQLEAALSIDPGQVIRAEVRSSPQ